MSISIAVALFCCWLANLRVWGLVLGQLSLYNHMKSIPNHMLVCKSANAAGLTSCCALASLKYIWYQSKIVNVVFFDWLLVQLASYLKLKSVKPWIIVRAQQTNTSSGGHLNTSKTNSPGPWTMHYGSRSLQELLLSVLLLCKRTLFKQHDLWHSLAISCIKLR